MKKFGFSLFYVAIFIVTLDLFVDSVIYADDPTPEVVVEKIALFNGKNLDGWSVFIAGKEPGEDPDNVFSVEDGVLHISGNGVGGIASDRAFRDYQIIVEFKWGDKSWAPREDRCRDGGLLLHSVGQEGAYGGCWRYSIETNIIEGGLGDFIVVGDNTEKYAITAKVKKEKSKLGAWIYDPNGTPERVFSGRVDWFARDPEWTDTHGFRGKDDLDKPLGEWNELKVVCRDDTLDVYVNGTLVNQAYDVKPSAGRIQIQTELAEYFIRRIEIQPLDK
ncbi:MAG: DUF1080 domain-containing protein [Thermoguttaceae bacterium]|nr:DUF1080 domain-containing protein [Thermoguttaceae bacterium]